MAVVQLIAAILNLALLLYVFVLLARLILEGRIGDGDRVRVDAGEHGLLINGTAATQLAA